MEKISWLAIFQPTPMSNDLANIFKDHRKMVNMQTVKHARVNSGKNSVVFCALFLMERLKVSPNWRLQLLYHRGQQINFFLALTVGCRQTACELKLYILCSAGELGALFAQTYTKTAT